MFSRVLVLLLSACASIAAIADITLQVPEHLEVLSINGKEVKGNLMQQSRHYSLAVGETVVELRYNDIQEASIGDSHTTFRSNPVGIRFNTEDNHYYLLHAPRPSNEAAAAIFNKTPKAVVLDRATLNEVKQTFFDISAQKKNELLAAANSVSSVTTPAPAPTTIAPTATATPNSEWISQNLWYWWQQADEATRKQFLRRIVQ